jgi:hypothetical protein
LTEPVAPTSLRTFTGTLPEVTVSDSRIDTPAGRYWYVLGTASDFVATDASGNPAIPAEQLGWTPVITSGTSSEVDPGDEVKSSLEDSSSVGVTDQALLFNAFDSGDIQPGSWKASAALTLKTDLSVAHGSYRSTLVLSLFENDGL